ncbi:MAG: hypothetical protein ABFD91_03035 [Anaerohalosphaeraceae bacterium]
MKKKNYSKRAIAAANGFLANYHLTVEHLTEAQKQSVLYYVKLKSCMYWALPMYILVITIFICLAWLNYSLAQETMQIFLIPPTTVDASLENSFNLMLLFGIIIGGLLYCGIMTLGSAIMYPISLWHKKKTLDAFLCNIKPVTNDQAV